MNEEMSKDLYERAVKHMPGGVNSPVRAYKAVDRVPRFIASAKGDRITDVDGNEMIDYICSWGPGILGHAHDRVIAKVKEAAEAGLTYGAPTKREVEMAELIYELIPTMEVSRLVSSGTEAVMSAIRVARGYTRRDSRRDCSTDPARMATALSRGKQTQSTHYYLLHWNRYGGPLK